MEKFNQPEVEVIKFWIKRTIDLRMLDRQLNHWIGSKPVPLVQFGQSDEKLT